jgi:hypothetical protein
VIDSFAVVHFLSTFPVHASPLTGGRRRFRLPRPRLRAVRRALSEHRNEGAFDSLTARRALSEHRHEGAFDSLTARRALSEHRGPEPSGCQKLA